MKMVLAWALFDLANTFFAVAMLSFDFPLWLVEERGVKELFLSLALGGSMGVVALLMPLCGALSDATGERMRFLRWTTYGCAAATVLIGFTSHIGVALVLFGCANVCYHLGTVFYDALLWKIAPAGQLGQTSGLGAAFGYVGSMLGLLLLSPFVQGGGHQAAFAPSAVLFLLFALPSFLIIREPPRLRQVSWTHLIRIAALRLTMTVRSAHAIAGLWRYLWASFFSSSAITTVLLFMAVYTKQVARLEQRQLLQFFIFSQLWAVAGALVWSRFIPRWGAKRTLALIWCGWIGALAVAVANPAVRWLWIIGPVIGFCLGATWSTARVLVTQLAPKEQLAEMFGLAGLFSKVSSIIGPLIWAALVWDPGHYRHALGALIGLLLMGLFLLRRVPGVEAR